jgi:hypothetical protein
MAMEGFYELTPAQQGERVAALARAALESWGLEARELTLLKYRENAVFRVAASDGRRYAIRIHRAGYHSDAELRSELQWMLALSADGFDVPELVATRRGNLFEVVSHPDVPEPRQVDLFGWIDGRQLGSVESGVEGDVETLSRTSTRSACSPPACTTSRPGGSRRRIHAAGLGRRGTGGGAAAVGPVLGAGRAFRNRARAADSRP